MRLLAQIGPERRPPSDLGTRNTKALEAAASRYSNATMIDLGVRFGYSSEALLRGSSGHNCIVHGVDIDFSRLPRSLRSAPNYEYTAGDSATAGRYWNPLRKVSLLFVDTIHVKEMILVELRAWQPHLQVGSMVVFHDTNWEVPGGESIAGRDWDRPEAAVVDFFGLPTHSDYEDEFVRVKVMPESNGMTFVEIRKATDFSRNVEDWKHVVESRNVIIREYSTDLDIARLGIDMMDDITR